MRTPPIIHFSHLIFEFSFQSTFLEPGLWPLLVSGTNYKLDSATTTILRQSTVFHSIHQLVQSRCIDAAALDNADIMSKVSRVSTGSVTHAARELLVQKISDKTNLSPALLSLVFLGDGSLSSVLREPIHGKVCRAIFASACIYFL